MINRIVPFIIIILTSAYILIFTHNQALRYLATCLLVLGYPVWAYFYHRSNRIPFTASVAIEYLLYSFLALAVLLPLI